MFSDSGPSRPTQPVSHNFSADRAKGIGLGIPENLSSGPHVHRSDESYFPCFSLAPLMSTRSLADALSERLLDSFPADQAYTKTDWAADAMPGPLRHYLTHLLRHHHRREARQLRRARTNWVDYHDPEMEAATRSFLDAVEQNLQVPPDQWAGTLRTAARRTTAYLVRPVPTLKSFVFEEADGSVPTPQVRWRMRFFGPYAYLRDAVQAFAEKRDRDAFSPDVFERVLRRVDERMTADFSADRWGDLLDPLFDTARRATGRTQVPLSLLRTFFEEKNAAHLAERLATHAQTDDAEAVSPETLRRLIESAATEAAPTADAAASPDAPAAPLDANLHDTTDSASPSRSDTASAEAPSSDGTSPDDASSDAAPKATPMWKQFEHDATRRRTQTSASAPDNSDDAQPLWAQFQQRPSDASPAPDAPTTNADSAPSSSSETSPSTTEHEDALSDLEQEVFGPSHTPKRKVYVQTLFNGDRDAYRDVLRRLRTAESWSEASQIISSDVFRTYQVNIYSDAAVHFTNAIEATFR